MSNIDGDWDCVMKTPMGPQQSVLTLKSDGADGFTGTSVASQGSVDVRDGKIDGNTLTWKMDVTTPVKLTLEAKMTLEGDTMTGSTKLGTFGSAPTTATRR